MMVKNRMLIWGASLVLWGLVSGVGMSVQAQSPRRSCSTAEEGPGQCTRRDRPSTSFSEEESRGIEVRGFSDSFLNDALSGVADPLAGGGAGAATVDADEMQQLSPVDRGLTDPTNVFIPIPSLP
ncbi:hypothetical protein AY600_14485 [Phormidium willei BDU 130791]|nr:hypothetical protein AY600_14485 [Phormidium willei BDU 130791]